MNGMVLTPGGVFVMWEYEWLVVGESDKYSDTDKDIESEVNRDTTGVTETDGAVIQVVTAMMTPFLP